MADTVAARVLIQEMPFDVGAELASLQDGEAAGGIGCFVGVVRREAAEGAIAALTIEGYPGMTEPALEEIAAVAIERFGLLGCTVIHRVGRLVPGEAIVLVATAAGHRGAALDGTRMLIDWLKTRAPLWKRHEFADGRTRWLDQSDADAAASEAWG